MPHQDGDRLPDWLSIRREPTLEVPGAVTVAGAATRTRAEFFAALAAALALPTYLGDTWDALADVVRDRLDAGPLTVCVDDASQLLADEPAGQYAMFLRVFGDLATIGAHPLRVLLSGGARGV
ncbi:barstar family protein [Micromonospora sp. CPCC 205539]|uniref:barstar family protein n=1 Tax=Micromonospora sp. CPCC 205539 TaxID=3122408 RepID=UPI002FF23F6A